MMMPKYIDADMQISKLSGQVESIKRLIENRPYDEEAKIILRELEHSLKVLTEAPEVNIVKSFAQKICRGIAGHSYYHGDKILCRVKCLAEGKECEGSVTPADVIEITPNSGDSWIEHWMFRDKGVYAGAYFECPRCGFDDCHELNNMNFCPKCGKCLSCDTVKGDSITCQVKPDIVYEVKR